ncbi:MAG: sigma-54 dependent transcriptional regulator [Archangium sp.]
MLSILLVEDEPAILHSVDEALRAEGHSVTTALDGLSAQTALNGKVYDVVISDVRLPRVDGLTLFKKARAAAPKTNFILMTAYATVPDAVAALKLGAIDYLPKPFELEALIKILERLEKERSLSRHFVTQRLAPQAEQELIGTSPAMVRLREVVAQYAQSDLPVSIVGERGSGKRLVALSLHQHSTRASRAFVELSCAAAADPLSSVEAQAAEGGTLYLTELADLPLTSQAGMLRALKAREAGNGGADVRVVTSSDVPLRELVTAGRLLEGLGERLRVLELPVPAVRNRGDDRMLLIERLLRVAAAPSSPPELSVAALAALSAYPFPGNVRELASALRRALVVSGGRRVELEHLPPEIAGVETRGAPDALEARSLHEAVRAFEREYLKRVLQKSEGHRARAAQLLGISRKSLWEKLKGYGIDDADLERLDTPPDQ